MLSVIVWFVPHDVRDLIMLSLRSSLGVIIQRSCTATDATNMAIQSVYDRIELFRFGFGCHGFGVLDKAVSSLCLLLRRVVN